MQLRIHFILTSVCVWPSTKCEIKEGFWRHLDTGLSNMASEALGNTKGGRMVQTLLWMFIAAEKNSGVVIKKWDNRQVTPPLQMSSWCPSGVSGDWLELKSDSYPPPSLSALSSQSSGSLFPSIFLCLCCLFPLHLLLWFLSSLSSIYFTSLS